MKALIFILFLLFIISTCSAATETIINGGFETGTISGWNATGSYLIYNSNDIDTWGWSTSWYPYCGNYGYMWNITDSNGRRIEQDVNFIGVDYLNISFAAVQVAGVSSMYVYLDSNLVYTKNWAGAASGWHHQSIDVSSYEDTYTLSIRFSASTEFTGFIDCITAITPTSTLSGYVTNNRENHVSAATITLNNSGGSTTSNGIGYYEITEIPSGTYSITATSPTHKDYSDTVTISGDTEKNITMTRLSPILTWTDAETTKNDVILKWRRNIVVDNVKIYKDTETRLLTTVSSGSTLAGLYSDRNLDCDKGYVYWLQPMDNDVAGPKYRIDAKTDPCDGGGGGTDPDPTPTPSPTPRPTVSPEEWVNLTLDEKILAKMLMFPPLLELKWEDVYVWGIHLFLILCGIVALDSITIQRVSEYTGLWAILPGVMFAYLTGYLVI